MWLPQPVLPVDINSLTVALLSAAQSTSVSDWLLQMCLGDSKSAASRHYLIVGCSELSMQHLAVDISQCWPNSLLPDHLEDPGRPVAISYDFLLACLIISPFALVPWLIARHSGGMSVLGRQIFPVLHSSCSWRMTTYVGKPSAICQPTRPTQPFIPLWLINE